MTGAPRDAYAPRKFIIISLVAVKALGGSWEAAGCFQRIAYKAERDGYWRATMKEVAAEIQVSERTAHRITKKLRDIGWVTAERENTWESTLTWRPIFADENANVAVPEDDEETAGQSTEGHTDTAEDANVAASGSPDLAASQDANVAGAHGANVAASLFSETTETNDEKSDVSSDAPSTPPMLTIVGATDGASSTPTIGEVVEELCTHLADRIEQNGSKRPTITQKWRDAARRLMEIDGKTARQVHNMIAWSQSNEFWCSNILSMPKLREKYDAMRIQAEQEVNRGGVYRRPADDPDELAARSVIG